MEFLQVILAATQATAPDGVDGFTVGAGQQDFTGGNLDCPEDFLARTIHLIPVDPDGAHWGTDGDDLRLLGLRCEADGRLGCDDDGSRLILGHPVAVDETVGGERWSD